MLLHVPRGAVCQVLQSFTQALTDLLDNLSWEALVAFMGFAKVVLAAPGRTGKKKSRVTAQLVISRATGYDHSKFMDLW